MTFKEIKEMVSSGILIEHHTSTLQGHVSRKLKEDDYPIEFYNGRFGNGFIVKSPRFDSSRFCTATYYIYEVK